MDAIAYTIHEHVRVLTHGHPLWGTVEVAFKPSKRHVPRSEQEEYLLVTFLVPQGVAEVAAPSTAGR
jgi:hypothetical protein